MIVNEGRSDWRLTLRNVSALRMMLELIPHPRLEICMVNYLYSGDLWERESSRSTWRLRVVHRALVSIAKETSRLPPLVRT
jgi:hypothetical protein